MAALRHDMYQKTVQDIVNLYENGHLNLSPGFQRDSVWTERDRAKLVDSIMRNYPIPAIFLYRRSSDGEIIYDVIDGKQRIESILMLWVLLEGIDSGAFNFRRRRKDWVINHYGGCVNRI